MNSYSLTIMPDIDVFYCLELDTLDKEIGVRWCTDKGSNMLKLRTFFKVKKPQLSSCLYFIRMSGYSLKHRDHSPHCT